MKSSTLITLASCVSSAVAFAQAPSYVNDSSSHFTYGTSREFGDVLNLSPSTGRHTITRVEFAFNNAGAAWVGPLTVRVYEGEPFTAPAVHQQTFAGVAVPSGNTVRAFDLSGVPAVASTATITIQGLGAGVTLRWFDPPALGTSGNYYVERDRRGANTGWEGLWFGPSLVANIYCRVWSNVTSGEPAKVRLVYLVPTDRSVQPCAVDAITNAGLHLQAWFQQQMGNEMTFTLHDPVVEVIGTSHVASWYSTNGTGDQAGRFWTNALADGFALTGGSFNDPRNRWIYYIDADPACGQVVGGTSGVALLPANDIRGLTGQQNSDPCGGPPDNTGLCRWIGGLGHELGHALGLPHPIACEDNDLTTECPANTLMWTGYATYPSATLLPENIVMLNQSPFFTVQSPLASVPSCSVAPQITGQPSSTQVLDGATAHLSVVATGGSLSFRWRHGGVDLADDARVHGSQTPNLTIDAVRASDAGIYQVLVSGSCGQVSSVQVLLRVLCPADLDDDGSFANGGTRDWAVTIEDLLFFLAAFEAGNIAADLDDDGDPLLGTPDGGVTIDDLSFFLARFERGC